MHDHKLGSPDHPVHELLTRRWSPYAFADRPVPTADLLALFEAARWAASSYNEQPWNYIVAAKDDDAAFQKVLSCLVDANQVWAKAAPVLALGCVNVNFKLNGKPNAAAEHDLGLAAGNMCVEATARGIAVHQMIGILPDKARQIFQIPADIKPLTGFAIGYAGDANTLPPNLQPRDLAPRTRKPLAEFVFAADWGKPSPLLK